MQIEIVLSHDPSRLLVADFETEWNRLSVDMVNLILSVFEAPTLLMQGEEAAFWQRLQIFKALTEWTDDDLKEWEASDLQTGATHDEWLFMLKATVEKATGFLFVDDGDGLTISPRLTKNPIPWIKVADKKGTVQKYYAAHATDEDPLSNAPLNEMSHFFALYEAWRSEGDIKHLNQLIAILYRKAKPKTAENVKRNYDGDIREPLETYQSGIDRRAALLQAHLSQNMKRVIAFHIVSCRAKLSELYPNLFTRSQNTEGGDWLDFVLELGDYDITKNALILQQDAHDALTTAERLVKRNKTKAK